jgi:polyisoprenoid-binding protein YceI
MKTIKKLASIVFIIFGVVIFTNAQSFVVNNGQSTVKWTGKKVGGEHYGTIKFSSGTLLVSNGQVSSGVFEIDMTTIVCEDITNEGSNQRLVNHLKSDDFFSVETNPKSRMTITGVKKTSGNEYEFAGTLTIKGISNPITFKAKTDVSGSTLKASGTMVVDRAKYDIKFRSASFFQNLGDNLIYDDFTLDFSMVANAQ